MKLDFEQYTLQTRVQWLMIVRLIVITISLILGVAVFDISFGKFYYYVYFHYIVSLLYIILVQRTRHHAFLGAFQLAIDLFVISLIVLSTDPIHSMFGVLYVLVILTSNIVFPAYGGILTALLACILFCGVVLQSQRMAPQTARATGEYAIYVTYLYVMVFLGTGYLSHYISRLLAQKNAELRQLQEQSSYVFHNINSGMFIADESGSVIFANPAAGRLLNTRSDDLLGIHWHCLLGVNDAESSGTRDALARGQEVEVKTCDRLGAVIHIAASVSAIAHPVAGRFSTVLFRDLSQQRAQERRERDANRLAGIVELAATIAHEIRNPLTSLSGSAELLRDRVIDGESLRLVSTIVREVERVDSIVEDFLTFTRLRSMTFQLTDLNELMTDLAVLLYHNRKFTPKTKIVYRELSEPLTAVVDPKQLKQAVLNLGLNALDAMPAGGDLSLSLTCEEETKAIIITVQDTGPGIAPDVRERMFEPFYSTKESGSGIGLYVTRRIVESHGGTIEVTSVLEKGTTFTIRLPQRQQEQHS
jgi:two-component system sensor histidine kinase PilS (NtrC family)